MSVSDAGAQKEFSQHQCLTEIVPLRKREYSGNTRDGQRWRGKVKIRSQTQFLSFLSSFFCVCWVYYLFFYYYYFYICKKCVYIYKTPYTLQNQEVCTVTNILTKTYNISEPGHGTFNKTVLGTCTRGLFNIIVRRF